jgi:hypothetical protein
MCTLGRAVNGIDDFHTEYATVLKDMVCNYSNSMDMDADTVLFMRISDG